MRLRKCAFLVGIIPLAGCFGTGLPPPVPDTSMPVGIDYREHRVLNPPPQHEQGRVDRAVGGPARAAVAG